MALHPGPRSRCGAELIRTNVRAGTKRPGGAVEVERRHALSRARVDGTAGGLEVIVATAIGLIVHQLRISVDGVDVNKSVLQDNPRSVVPNQVVHVLVVCPRRTYFDNGIALVFDEDIVGYDGVIVGYAPRSIAIPDNDAALAVSKTKVISNHHIVGSMPEMDSPACVAV